MHATSTQPKADQRMAAKAALAAVRFQALHPDATGFRLQRDGEIGLGGATTNALRDQRHGEIGAGAGPAENALRAQRRGEIDAGQQ